MASDPITVKEKQRDEPNSKSSSTTLATSAAVTFFSLIQLIQLKIRDEPNSKSSLSKNKCWQLYEFRLVSKNLSQILCKSSHRTLDFAKLHVLSYQQKNTLYIRVFQNCTFQMCQHLQNLLRSLGRSLARWVIVSNSGQQEPPSKSVHSAHVISRIEVSRESVEVDRDQVEVSRESVEVSRESEEVSRELVEVSRESVDVSRCQQKSVESQEKSVEVSRASQ